MFKEQDVTCKSFSMRKSLQIRLPWQTQRKLIWSLMTAPGEYSTQRKILSRILTCPHALFTCVICFAELLLWLAIQSASARKSTQLVKNLLSLGLLTWYVAVLNIFTSDFSLHIDLAFPLLLYIPYIWNILQ